jgi:hypothetical protein
VISIASISLLLILVFVALFFCSYSFTAGIAIGGIIAIINCRWMYSILKRAMQLPSEQGVRYAQMRYYSRFAIIAVVLAILIIYTNVNVFGLLVGLSVLVLAIFGVTAYMATSNGG